MGTGFSADAKPAIDSIVHDTFILRSSPPGTPRPMTSKLPSYALRGQRPRPHVTLNTFKGLDAFTRRRLRALLRRQEKQTSRMGKSLADHKRWPIAFFDGHGLISLQGARIAARQSSRR